MNKLKIAVAASAAAIAAVSPVAMQIIAPTKALEGGYVNHPSDPGGETNKGITKKVALEHGYTGPMKTIPDAVVDSIFYQGYLVKPGYVPLIALDAAVTTELFDTTVNMGPARPGRFFQQAITEICPTVKVTIDGQVGPATIAAFATCQRVLLCRAMIPALDAKQRAEYDRLVRINPNLKVFYRGWVNHRIGNVKLEKCG